MPLVLASGSSSEPIMNCRLLQRLPAVAMQGVRLAGALAVAGLGLVIGSSFYSPLPSKMCGPHYKILIMDFFWRQPFNVAYLLEKLGLGETFQLVRKFQSLLGELQYPALRLDPQIKISEVMIDGSIRTRIYVPKDAQPNTGGIVLFHGGGWVSCNIEIYHGFVRQLAIHTKFIIFSVDYRKAPEHPFPAAFQDCLNVTKHVLEKAASYGVSPHRVAVMGDSAGGNIAAAVALAISTDPTQNIPLKRQILVYPVVQMVHLNLPSYQLTNLPVMESAEAMALVMCLYLNIPLEHIPQMAANNHTSAEFKARTFSEYFHPNIIGEHHYRGQEMRTDFGNDELFREFVDKHNILSPYVSPLFSKDLDKLPETFLLSVEFDFLRDECKAYVHRLRQEGVPVEHVHVENGFHGMLNIIKGTSIQMEAANKLFRKTVTYIKKNL